MPVQGATLLPVPGGNAKKVHPVDQVYGWELFGARSIHQGDWQLFDIRKGPFEQHDLSVAEPDRFARMQRERDEYAAENGVIY